LLGFGINPELRVAPGCLLQRFMPSGMLTNGFGNSLLAGGENASAFLMGSYLPGNTVKIEGEAFIESGVPR
jgi:hypothetical protein